MDLLLDEAALEKLASLRPRDCDYVALVRYPSTAAFRDMIVSAEYQPGNIHRLNGIERHVIIATQEAYGRFRDD